MAKMASFSHLVKSYNFGLDMARYNESKCSLKKSQRIKKDLERAWQLCGRGIGNANVRHASSSCFDT